jgi:hypothetical protein
MVNSRQNGRIGRLHKMLICMITIVILLCFYYNDMLSLQFLEPNEIYTSDFSFNKIKSRTTIALGKVKFINSINGFSTNKNGEMLKTNDGGNTWTLLSSKKAGNYYSVFTAAPDSIYTGDCNGAFTKSSNGGRTCSPINGPVEGKGIMYWVYIFVMNTRGM